LQKAVELERTAHAYALIGMVHAKQNRSAEALAALDVAEKLNPKFQQTYVYRGNILLLNSEFDQAAEQFRRAIELNPADPNARSGLDMAQRRVTPRLQ
jgi:tetratricopeptide (TPR) repeat protein